MAQNENDEIKDGEQSNSFVDENVASTTVDADTAPTQKEDTLEVLESTEESKEQPSKAGNSHTGDNFAEQVQYINQQLNFSEQSYSVKKFNFAMAHELSVEEEQSYLTGSFLHNDEGDIEAVLQLLRTKHLLVISGEADSGRYALSQFLANKLRGLTEMKHKNLCVPALNDQVRIDIQMLPEEMPFIGGRVIIFKDALSRRNRDIREFLENVPSEFLKKLSAIQCYMIFSIDKRDGLKLEPYLEKLGLCMPMPYLCENKLLDALAKLCKESNLSDTKRKEIVTFARTIPRLHTFITKYLQAVEDGLEVKDAFQRLEDLPRWFLTDLPENFETWHFAFVSALAQCVTKNCDGIPWTEFVALQNALREPLRDVVGEPKRIEQYYRKERLNDDTLLTATTCRIEYDTDTQRDTLRFEDADRAEQLWEIFLLHNRTVLVAILPALIKIATHDSRHTMRIHAARIIGRLGEIDPDAIIYPLIDEWSESENLSRNATLGYLFQGVISSANKTYCKIALTKLDQLANHKKWLHVRAAIIAYKQIGILDLSLSMQKLKQIAVSNLAKDLTKWQDIVREGSKQKNQSKTTFKNSGGNERFFFHAFSHFGLNELAKHLYGNQIERLSPFQYTLTALCISLGPIRVFEELQTWLDSDEGMPMVVILILLLPGGIAWEIEGRVVGTMNLDGENDKDLLYFDLMVYALATEHDAPRKMAVFLEKLFGAFQNIPRDIEIDFMDLFFAHLFTWLRSSLDFDKGREAMEGLFILLLKSKNTKLKTKIREKLQNSLHLEKQDGKFADFHKKVLRESF